jgi:hypothetical protein
MKIQTTNLLTGKTAIRSARLTCDHPASRYGQPVLLVADEPWGVSECVFNNIIVIVPPKRKSQIALYAKWQQSATQMMQ